MWNFKGTLWHSTQNILPIHWKIWFLYDIEILRVLRFKSSYAFLRKKKPAPYTSRQRQTFISTHWGHMTHICISKWATIGLDNGLSEHWLASGHYLNQCWSIEGTPGNKLQGNFNQNSYIFINENPFENVIWKMAILSQPQCVNVTF